MKNSTKKGDPASFTAAWASWPAIRRLIAPLHLPIVELDNIVKSFLSDFTIV